MSQELVSELECQTGREQAVQYNRLVALIRRSEAREADLKAKLDKALNHLGNALRISMRNEASDELDDAADFLAATLKELSE